MTERKQTDAQIRFDDAMTDYARPTVQQQFQVYRETNKRLRTELERNRADLIIEADRANRAEAERDALRKSAERRLRLLRDVKENLDVAKANSGAYAFDKFAGHLPTCVSPRGDQACQCGYSSVRFNIESLLEECNSAVEGSTMYSVSAEIDAALAKEQT